MIDLNILLLASDFDLIFVTETRLHSAITDSLLLSNSSYTLIRKDRPDKFGGVAILVKHGLKTVCIDLTSCFQQLECITFDVLFPSQQYRFICIYNPPSLANDIAPTSCLCSFLDNYCNSKMPVVMVGDFNYPNIDWSVPVNTGSMCSSLFLTSILQSWLTQLVNLPTRGNHYIDLVMVSDVSMMFDISVVDLFVVSCDHSSVEFMVICPCNHPANSISYRRDIRSKIDSVYIDFAKVFDSISHRKLLYKVECYGFTPLLVRWLSSFLMNCFQQVHIDQSLFHTCYQWCSSGISAWIPIIPHLYQ